MQRTGPLAPGAPLAPPQIDAGVSVLPPAPIASFNERRVAALSPPSADLAAALAAPGPYPPGDPATPWTAVDWDLVLVLPLPEARAAAADTAAEEAAKGDAKKTKMLQDERR